MSWKEQCTQRLLAAQHESGGWPYRLAHDPASEPTALACLALRDSTEHRAVMRRGLEWLASLRQADGGAALTAQISQPRWATALVYLAWHQCAASDQVDFSTIQANSLKWLLANKGKTFTSNPALYGHDTQLTGWPWVADTHSWVEPTAYAILALRAAGLRQHLRVREGVALLLDRAMPHGGWNYGNSRMFGSELRPFPDQTGMALAALAGEPRPACVVKGLDFLYTELPRIRTPFSLGWALIGATAWHAKPVESKVWLAQCADRVARRPVEPIHDAMLLLAGADSCPLLSEQGEARAS